MGEFELPRTTGLRVFGAGKAAATMVGWFTQRLQVPGFAIDRDLPSAPVPGVEISLGGHPVPTAASLLSGEEMLRRAAETPSGESVVFCLSGGASALMEALMPGVSLTELQAKTKQMLADGSDIRQINAYRRSVSRTKAGGLAKALQHTNVVLVVLSDVMGDPLATIGSGPFFPDEALVPHVIIGNNQSALRAAEAFATAHGILGQIVDPMLGEARDQFARYDHIARPNTLIIAGGEPTVRIVGHGKGGRAQEAALAAAIEIQNQAGITVLSAGTDGSDGPTDAAGAIVTGDTIDRGGGIEGADKALANNDSYPFLDRAGALIRSGPTGTNVNDLFLILRI